MKVGLDFLVNQENVFKLLNCKEDNENYELYKKTYKEVLKIAKDNVEPTLYYALLPNDLINIKNYKDCKEVAYCLITLNKKIDEIIEGMFESYDYLKALMLSTIGDEVLFNSTKQMNELFKVNSKKVSIVRSPGTVEFTNDYQYKIIKKLENILDVNIDVTSGYMLNPQKSMSYIIGLDGLTSTEENCEHECNHCIMKGCKYKDVYQNSEGHR